MFSWSYRALNADAARLFRFLALHPGPDLTLAAAASLAGIPAARLRPRLFELTRANLLNEHVPDRFVLHDLLRVYAKELADAHDTEADRRVAARRLLDHYVHTAHAAALAIHPHRHPISLRRPESGVTVIGIVDSEQALAWFANERTVLLVLVGHAARERFDTHAWQLAWTLTDLLDRQGHWHDLASVQQIALEAARRTGEASPQAHAHRALARASVQLGRLDEARTHYRHSLELFGARGDRAGQAHTHLGLGWVLDRQGQVAEAIGHDRQALELFRAIDHRLGQARALNHLGIHEAQLGEHQQSLVDCQAALVLFEEVSDRFGQAATHDSLGDASHRLGRHDQAITHYQRSIDLLREIGDRYYEAQALTHLGDTHHDAGEDDAARIAWRQAFRILRALAHPDADQVTVKLAAIGTATEP